MSSIANTSVSGSLKLKGGISLGKKKKKSKKKKRKRDAEKTSDVSSSTTSTTLTDDAKRAKTTAPIKDTRTASEKSMDAIVRRKVSLFQSTWCRFFNSFGCVSFVLWLTFFFLSVIILFLIPRSHPFTNTHPHIVTAVQHNNLTYVQSNSTTTT